MATTYSLDQLREDVERKYGPFIVQMGAGKSVTLLPLMRLPEDKRARFGELQRKLGEQQADPTQTDLAVIGETIREILRTVAEKPAGATALLNALPDDAYALQLFEKYAAASMPGEASDSPS